jgi:dynein heavy chain, axonemal
MLNEDEP